MRDGPLLPMYTPELVDAALLELIPREVDVSIGGFPILLVFLVVALEGVVDVPVDRRG